MGKCFHHAAALHSTSTENVNTGGQWLGYCLLGAFKELQSRSVAGSQETAFIYGEHLASKKQPDNMAYVLPFAKYSLEDRVILTLHEFTLTRGPSPGQASLGTVRGPWEALPSHHNHPSAFCRCMASLPVPWLAGHPTELSTMTSVPSHTVANTV